MKTHKNLWSGIANFQNLLLAAQKAQRGKRLQPNVARFNIDLEHNLFQLLSELESGAYQPGAYRSFYILDPKPRMISAAPYRDRVVHHALCNAITPILENAMIADSYANREGKGTHAALERYREYGSRYTFVLKCDVKKFFPSIDHDILKRELRRKISCARTLQLCDRIIDNSNPQEEHLAWFPGDDLFTPSERRRGLPIGNLTSQLWGNYYLNRMDHFIKETLRCKAYIRYVDDFVIFSNSKEELWAIKKVIEIFLQDYRLLLHERKSRVCHTSEGVTFLGYRMFPDFTLLPSANVRRFRKRTMRNVKKFWKQQMSAKDFDTSIRGWEGHALRANTWRLRMKLKKEIFGK
jgi:RNA-directed DNA polymerase